MSNEFCGSWFPVIRAEEVAYGHVARVQLNGQELAIWRDDEGHINAWENRCPHRGVRFSLGHTLGNELRCQYHGWRFASRTGQCTYIPAQPGHKPAQVVKAVTYACLERYRYVWVSLNRTPAIPEPTLPLGNDGLIAVRSLQINAPMTHVITYLRTLAKTNTWGNDRPISVIECQVIEIPLDTGASAADRLLLLPQPASKACSVIHGIADSTVEDGARLPFLRRQNELFKRFKSDIEQ